MYEVVMLYELTNAGTVQASILHQSSTRVL